jgi:glutamine amidotransferase
LKVPHIGWSRIAVRGTHPVLDVPAQDNWFYFVHSFHAQPVDETLIAAVTTFGNLPVTAAVARDNVVAVQYHPEKSQAAGLELLRQFAEWKC